MKYKITAWFSLTKGIIMTMLGIVHVLAFLVIPDKIFEFPLSGPFYREFAVWFNLGGVLFIYSGINDILVFRGLKGNMPWARIIAFASAIICLTFSFAGILIFREGPPFLIFAISILQIAPLLLFGNGTRD